MEEERPVWESGKPEKGRKKEIQGGGRDQERKARGEAARGTRL